MLSHQPSFTNWVKDAEGRDVKTPVEFHNVLALDQPTVGWIVKGCMGLFGLLVLWKCRAPISDRNSSRLVAEFGIVILGMLLFSERTWKHHCVTLLVPFAVLAHYVSTQWSDRPGRWVSLGAMAVATILMTLTSTGLSDVTPIRPFARALVMIEQLAGLAYVAMLVSRVVALTVLRRAN